MFLSPHFFYYQSCATYDGAATSAGILEETQKVWWHDVVYFQQANPANTLSLTTKSSLGLNKVDLYGE